VKGTKDDQSLVQSEIALEKGLHSRVKLKQFARARAICFFAEAPAKPCPGANLTPMHPEAQDVFAGSEGTGQRITELVVHCPKQKRRRRRKLDRQQGEH
jgi:hypothetical protein